MPTLGLIFDLDGVLVETAHLHTAAWRQVALSMGATPKHLDTLDFRGVKREQCLDLIFRNNKLSAEASAKALHDKNEMYQTAVKDYGKALLTDGVRHLLIDLRKNKYKMAIATASRNADLILNITGLRALVDEVCDGSFTGRTKPAPDQFIEAAKIIGCKPERCVVFEDSNVGVDGARDAHSYIIGIGPAVKNRPELTCKFETLSRVAFHTLHEIISDIELRVAA